MNPIVNKKTKILILGTFPGKASLEKNEYYSDKNNDFWKLIGIDKSLKYKERIEKMEMLGIGIWDVFKNVQREGSIDLKIESGDLNDFMIIRKKCLSLKIIYFNGKKIINRIRKIKKCDIEEMLEKEFNNTITIKSLYSSSGANRKYIKERKKEWQIFKKSKM